MSESNASFLIFPSLLCQLLNVCIKNPAPEFPADIMRNVTAVKGEDVIFSCRVTDPGRHMVAFVRAEMPPRLIAFDEKVFRQRDKYEVRKKPSEDEWLLVVKDVQESDIGGYICQLNSNPVITRTAYLDLRIPPLVSRSSTPSAVEVQEGHNVTLSCQARGNPLPSVIWRRQDRQIIRFNGATGYGASVYNGSELHLTKVSRKHMSEYVCVASNGIPPDESWTVKLHVTFAPTVIPQTTVVQARKRSLVRLVCNVEAWPRPLVTWYLNDEELFDSNKYSTEQSVAERYKSVHVLEIKEIEATQFGIYRCVATNDHGKDYADIQLTEAASYELEKPLLSEGSGSSDDDEDSDASSVAISVEKGNSRRSNSPQYVPDDESSDIVPILELRYDPTVPSSGPSNSIRQQLLACSLLLAARFFR